MANLIYRASLTPPTPASTVLSELPLSNLEVDGNFKSLNDELITKVSLQGSYSDPSWITSIAGSKLTGTVVATNGVVTTGTYADPSWITSLAGSKVTNAVLTTGTYANPSWITSLAETKVLPTQSGNSGKFLTTNGSSSSWATVDALPSQTGNSGKFLTTNGSVASWTAAAVSTSDDTTTDATYYPSLFMTTSGSITNTKVSSTKLYFNPSTGTLNATTFNSLSDVTQKANVKPIENATETLNKIDAVEFDWVDTGKHSSGVIAQKLEEVLPFLVETNDTGTKSVNYSGLIAYLIQSNKELSQRISALETK